MNGTILGVGPLEVLFILILILLVFGPERLPEFTRGLGKALRRLRETYVAFTQEFKGELQPIAQDLDEVTREIRREVQAIREAADIRAILQPYADDINKAVSLNPTPSAPALPPASSLNGAAAPANAAASSLATPRVAEAAQSNAALNGPAATAPSHISPGNHLPIELSDDNPWASVGATIRTDRLDDDNPWRA